MARSRNTRALLAHAEPATGSDGATSPGRGEPLLDPVLPHGVPAGTELFVWFEDTRSRRSPDWQGAAGFPECLLPYGKGVRVLERRYVDGHLHLLAAARIRCDERLAECVAMIYTQALALGTIAWIGTGEQYRRAWTRMYARGAKRARRRGEKPVS